MTEADWSRVCVVCSARGRETKLEAGHCCAGCAKRIDGDLADILRRCADAAAWIPPASSTSATGSRIAGSRPPLTLDAIEPEMTIITPQPSDPTSAEPLLHILESWERLIRDERGFAQYGPATQLRHHAAEDDWTGPTPRPDDSHRTAPDTALAAIDTRRAADRAPSPAQVTLTGVIGFLRSQVEYATTEPGFSLVQFAREIALCAIALRRYDPDREGLVTWRVECPTDTPEGVCGHLLRLAGQDITRHIRCRECGTDWTVDRLMHVAAATSQARMWLDADAILTRTGISRRTLDRWVREGRIVREHGLYDARPILAATRTRGA